MPQNPFQVDQLKIEPGSGDTITISRDSGDGSIAFVDAVLTGGVKLSEIIGIQSLTNVFVVGSTLIGASHTTIQSALDDVPTNASDTNPYLILVASGSYQEDIIINKSGVSLVALGYVLIQNLTATATITIQEDVAVPEFVVLQGFHIKNSSASQGCVSVVGASASTVASTMVSIKDCHFVATGTGSYPIKASSANRIYVKGGSMKLCGVDSFCLIEEVVEFFLSEVSDITAVSLDYDATGDLPSVANSKYKITNCNFNSNSTVANSISSNLSGGGDLFVSNVPDVGDVSLDGDRNFTFNNCILGAIVSSNAIAISLKDCKRGVASGLGTLSESKSFGSLTFANSSSEVFTFGINQPDLNYFVLIENDRGTATTDTAYVSTKAVGSLTVTFSSPVSTQVSFVVLRDI